MESNIGRENGNMKKIKLPKIFQPYYCDDLIRLGKNNDGGYLINKQDVLMTKKIISFGIGKDCSFEQDFTNINDCELYAFDINKLEDNIKPFFNKKRKFKKQNINNLDLNKILNSDKIFLKCDIEGSEYELLDKLIEHNKKFIGLVIEFHEITNNENFNKLTNFISKIDQKLIHTHINNYFYYKTQTQNIPDILELTFTNSINIKYKKELKLPNVLDMPNNSNDEEFEIYFD